MFYWSLLNDKWYRHCEIVRLLEGVISPVFSYDSRDEEVSEARHWSDVHVMAGRAFFKEKEEPAHLALENVLGSDVGSYKCRVDFYKAPTQISEVVLDVIGESYKYSQIFLHYVSSWEFCWKNVFNFWE